MHNLIKSRAVFEILKKPLPELLQFYKDSEAESDSADTATDGATVKANANASDADTDAAQLEMAAKLNVNANEFVPRSKNEEHGELKRHFEALDERKPIQPKLVLPWKGFPRPLRPERPSKATLSKKPKEPKVPVPSEEQKTGAQQKHPQTDTEAAVPSSRKKQVKENVVAKPVDEKRLEQERKVALEALKLAEQRRMREPIETKPEITVHLTRSPVDFTPEERERVDRLRLIKRERIERVLREMRQELEEKAESIKPSGRYISLKRAVKREPEPAPEAKSQQQQQPPTNSEASVLPKRYIPTAKQWDERCRAKAHEVANKENNASGKTLTKQEVTTPPQRAMGPSSVGNIMPSAAAAATAATATTAAGNGRNISSNNNTKSREVFVPRYWPPAPLVATGEQRRGNLTHARNITRAFANCGLLPTPSLSGDSHTERVHELPEKAQSVKRYNMEQLLEWEPQPHELQKPHFAEALCKLGFISE